MTWGERVKTAGRFAWANIDALLVVLVAFGVLIVEVVGNPKSELVDSAILCLLGVTAIVLLRDRSHRVDLKELRQLARDAMSDLPYEVLWQTHEWDLKDRETSLARVTEQLRFTRNDISLIADWSTGAGIVERYEGKWRRSDEDRWIPARVIHKLPIRNGEKVIYSLEEEHSRGDMLEWHVKREAVGRFPARHESVSVSARAVGTVPRTLRITWPVDAPPSHVEMRREGRPARTLVTKRRNEQILVEERVTDLDVGEAVVIQWNW